MNKTGSPSRSGDSEPGAEGPGPKQLSPESAQTGALVRALQETMKDALNDLRNDIREVRTDLKDIRNEINKIEPAAAKSIREEFHKLLLIFGGGFIAVIAVFGWGYTRLDDHMLENTKASTKDETKLDDLIARIPPVQASPSRAASPKGP
jgi:hypothetical protein